MNAVRLPRVVCAALQQVRVPWAFVPVFLCLIGTEAAAQSPCDLAVVSAAAGRGQWLLPDPLQPPSAWVQWLGEDGKRCRVALTPAWAGRVTAVAVSAPPEPLVLAVATQQPAAVHFLDARLQQMHTVPVRDRGGRVGSPVCALQVLPQRQSFVALFSRMPEVWELSYRPTAAEIGTGMVHDFQYREGQFIAGYLNPMRSSLPWSAARFALDGSGHALVVHPAEGHGTAPVLVHLDVRKPIPEPLPATPTHHDCVVPQLLLK